MKASQASGAIVRSATAGGLRVKRLRDQPVFHFYVWASVIVDGQIVATDYAPDAGWITLRLPEADQ
jgi:hypothetical protein